MFVNCEYLNKPHSHTDAGSTLLISGMIRHMNREASVLVREVPGTSGNVHAAPGGKHGSFGKFKI
ncbi:hypothetical protein DPMN_044567 [Dreissena polymorpha]|uniref:Uncharacterized protein n=1 Tax=Dreissena polymorpha TaxID=45954 RepID=A0A9D4D2N8_DREPO|nr:hypothetical protein DPMN_044567 [Dreissena polymorpha]